ncbi:SRPBCC family protein [Paenibacillus lemnae]|uniref:SRPBCC domain-containing protein n=1 Tax=Paenibacillus lemnae TaxID=1330551 RepID=A0A848M7P3_PAELE|nr:SRPBCC domain-containing protein [Paenibacillus lemnae]NMO96102.1 SRPBCC domain-containing protein [Paenibacillus lemnae]
MDITQEIWIHADLELVWKAWTKEDRITEWFAPAARIEPRSGGAFELFFNPADPTVMSTKGCIILSYEAPHKLVFQWKGPDPFATIMNRTESLTLVQVSLNPTDSGTHVVLVHTGWGITEEWVQARQWHVQAWEQMLDSLKSSIESGSGKLCCQ